jgi:hypothetical protein
METNSVAKRSLAPEEKEKSQAMKVLLFPFYFTFNLLKNETRVSSVSIATVYGLDDRGFRVRFPSETGNFSPLHRVQSDSGAHPAS